MFSGFHVCVHSHTRGWTVRKKERRLNLIALPIKGPVWVVCGRYCVLWLSSLTFTRRDALIQDLFTRRLTPLPGILPCPLLQPEGFLHRLGELVGRQEVQDALFHQ